MVESIRALFVTSQIAKSYWHKFLKFLCLMLNQIPWKGEKESPWYHMHGFNLLKNFLKPIGTPAIYLLRGKKRVKGRKLNEKGEEVQLVGFDPKLQSYRLILPSRAVVCTRHVRFLKKKSCPRGCLIQKISLNIRKRRKM